MNGWMDAGTDGRKEMFYLTTHSTHFVYCYMASVGAWMNGWMDAVTDGRKEMFYLMTHSTHFVYCYMASTIMYRTIVRGNSQSPHGLLFSIISSGNITLLNKEDVIAFFVCTL